MAAFVKVAALSELPPGSGRTFRVGGRDVAVFNVGGAVKAIDDACAHMGGPLGEGSLEGCIVTCPWHGWRWDVLTGRREGHAERVTTHEAKVEDGCVFVALTPSLRP